ncbi:zinc ABC transporter substrate-binding protein ZnuA [Dickeya chrysanthemi]|uniref:zinc ABC transporter substrate-binding protein ZnuA n=1 Tax=Dickeya chrysanthemi TaxID=556 RepID=UPI00039EFCB8|nr:zinc ABC transporter substrate-binding protein ZnuA [Dickeya chrysanthemi]MBX9444963.1 zinc ABC transporter substrate-binding protein ZnuA [Dickeya chrysanthemi]
MLRVTHYKWLNAVLTTGTLLASLSAATGVSAAIVTSIRPLAFITTAIADGVTPTEVLLPDGASPHDYALRPSDVQRLKSADLVIWVGPEMEAFLPKALQSLPAERQLALSQQSTIHSLLLRESHPEQVAAENHTPHDADHDGQASDGHDHSHHPENHQDDDDDGHHHGEFNMHLWLSPEMAQASAVAIHAKLLERMPQNKDKLDANLRKFTEKLAQTDKNIVNMLMPVRGRGYFVFHDAYGYFERHYGLTPLGHFTINPAIAPGAQRLNQIRTQLVEHKAVCVFAEPQFRPAVINAVAKGTDVRIGVLDPLGSDIVPDQDSYVRFLSQLSEQYLSCLKEK